MLHHGLQVDYTPHNIIKHTQAHLNTKGHEVTLTMELLIIRVTWDTPQNKISDIVMYAKYHKQCTLGIASWIVDLFGARERDETNQRCFTLQHRLLDLVSNLRCVYGAKGMWHLKAT